MALACQTITHPTVTRPQIQDAKPIFHQGSDTWQNLPFYVAKRVPTERPLTTMKAGKISIGKRQVVVGVGASAAFRCSNGFIVLHEARVASHPLGQECLPD